MENIRQILRKQNIHTLRGYYQRTNRFVRGLGFFNVLFLSTIGLTSVLVLTDDVTGPNKPYYGLKLFYRRQPTETVYERP